MLNLSCPPRALGRLNPGAPARPAAPAAAPARDARPPPGPPTVLMLNLSCPPWALGRLNSGASAPTSGTASFCLRRVNMRPSLRVRKVLPEYYRLGGRLTRQPLVPRDALSRQTSTSRVRSPPGRNTLERSPDGAVFALLRGAKTS